MLDLDLLLKAYAIGVFPMSDGREAEDVFWVEPKKRAILPLDRFHISRSLRKTLRSGAFEVTRDKAFEEVVRRCAEREDTWINGAIEAGYVALHDRGHAHSVEVWAEDEIGAGSSPGRPDGGPNLVGGLYGVRLGGAFFGESMFSERPDASKVALAWLVARLRVGAFTLLDCQFMTEHLKSLGAIEIAQADYLQLLSSALGSGSGAGAAGAGAGAGAASFDALDRLLEERASGAGSPPPGWVISQLIGQTS